MRAAVALRKDVGDGIRDDIVEVMSNEGKRSGWFKRDTRDAR